MAVSLVIYFVKSDKGEKEPIPALWLAAGFGLAGTLLAMVLENYLLTIKNPGPNNSIPSLILTAVLVGLIEETCKFAPLAIYIYRKRYFNEHTDGLIYFAIAGLSFGLPENILYTIAFGSSAGLSRLILTPFFHAAITAAVGFYLVKLKLSGKSPFKVIPILLIAATVHAIYDFGLFSGRVIFALISYIITFGVTIYLFYLYFKANDLDKIKGLSAVGHNNYCRNCGKRNKGNLLYCARCGLRA